jgi:hypothetical protein
MTEVGAEGWVEERNPASFFYLWKAKEAFEFLLLTYNKA